MALSFCLLLFKSPFQPPAACTSEQCFRLSSIREGLSFHEMSFMYIFYNLASLAAKIIPTAAKIIPTTASGPVTIKADP